MKITTRDGLEVELAVPQPGTGPSFFVVSQPKAGSTLFNRIMRPVSEQVGASFYSLPNELHALGLPARTVGPDVNRLFRPQGFAYGGFRGIENPIRLPNFAAGRIVALVRDPRDMLCSLYFSEAFSHKPPGTAASPELAKRFEQRRQAALSETIEAFVQRRGDGLLATYVQMLEKIDGLAPRLWRYEDVIFDKERWIRDVLDHLGLAYDARRVANVVSRNDLRPAAEDASQHVRRVTPGDYREKLSPPTIEVLDAKFAPILDRFGYR
jgi:hypothetical protein